MDSLLNVEAPRVFLSYSWDSVEYKEWVARFAARLIEDGINARLDEWHSKDRGVSQFMNSEVRSADKVLMLCTPVYKQKVHDMEDGRSVTGSGYEAMLMTTELFDGEGASKMIPVVIKGTWNHSVPSFASGIPGYDLSGDSFNEIEYRRLLQHLHNLRPSAPQIGSRPLGLGSQPIIPLRGAFSQPTSQASEVNIKSQNADIDEKWDMFQRLERLPGVFLSKLIFYLDVKRSIFGESPSLVIRSIEVVEYFWASSVENWNRLEESLLRIEDELKDETSGGQEEPTITKANTEELKGIFYRPDATYTRDVIAPFAFAEIKGSIFSDVEQGESEPLISALIWNLHSNLNDVSSTYPDLLRFAVLCYEHAISMRQHNFAPYLNQWIEKIVAKAKFSVDEIRASIPLQEYG